MTASEHLSPHQFAPMHEVDHYESGDFDIPMHRVPAYLDHRDIHHGMPLERATTDHLIKDIGANGMHEPITVYSDNVVTDGHHRYAAAKALGHTHIPIDRKTIPWHKPSTR